MQPSPHPEVPPAGDAAATSLHRIIQQIAGDLEGPLSAGDVAELRRLRPDDATSPAFWKVVVHRLEPGGALPEGDGPWRVEAERRWTVILSGMAEMRGLHRAGRRLGRALAEGGIAEPRFLRLLRARGEGLFDLVRVTSHQLASGGQPVDWSDLALLVLSEGRRDEEAVRRRIARDYYRHAGAPRPEAPRKETPE